MNKDQKNANHDELSRGSLCCSAVLLALSFLRRVVAGLCVPPCVDAAVVACPPYICPSHKRLRGGKSHNRVRSACAAESSPSMHPSLFVFFSSKKSEVCQRLACPRPHCLVGTLEAATLASSIFFSLGSFRQNARCAADSIHPFGVPETHKTDRPIDRSVVRTCGSVS